MFFISFCNFCFKEYFDINIAISLSYFPFAWYVFFFSSLFPFPYFVSIWPLRTCLVLLHWSYTVLQFFLFDFSFFCSACVISTALSSSLLICSSVGFTLLLIPLSFFYFSYCILLLWFFFIFSVKNLTSYSVHSLFSPRTLISSTIITF